MLLFRASHVQPSRSLTVNGKAPHFQDPSGPSPHSRCCSGCKCVAQCSISAWSHLLITCNRYYVTSLLGFSCRASAAWGGLTALEAGSPAFSGISEAITSQPEPWESWTAALPPGLTGLPEPWGTKLGLFQRLLLAKVRRPTSPKLLPTLTPLYLFFPSPALLISKDITRSSNRPSNPPD